jgi:multidrug efflux system membrane fusion protein
LKRFLPTLVLLLITAAAAAFIYKDRIAERTAGKQEQPATVGAIGRFGERREDGSKPVPILVAAVEKADVPVYLHGVGTVRAFNMATVRAQVAGNLLSVEFNEGEMVKAGTVLARIDPARYKAAYDQAVAKKAIDESALANARADLARMETLAKSNYASEQSMDAQRAKVEQLRAQIRQDQAVIDSAKTDLDHTAVTAPIAGRTGIREVDAGNLVSATDLGGIVTISQLQPVSVMFTLAETHIAGLIAAQAAGPVALTASVAGRTLAEGTLTVIDNRIDDTTGTIRLKGTFANEPLVLWPGQFVNVRLHLKTLQDAVVVPVAALQQGATERYVYRVAAEGVVRQTPVRVAHEDESRAVVLGIAPSERVAVAGFSQLKDGAKVTVDQGPRIDGAPAAAQDAAPVGEKRGEAATRVKSAQRDTGN